MRIAAVVQRYGADIVGGAERLCRGVCEGLAGRGHEVEVLTTCATSYRTWANEYAAGAERVAGVTVRRFRVEQERDPEAFHAASEEIFGGAGAADGEAQRAWVKLQGPYAPSLIDHLHATASSFDRLLFFTYLYYPTVHGIHVAPERSVLVPTAHDEAPVYLPLYEPVFALPAGLVYNTEAEAEFVRRRFPRRAGREAVIGVGIDALDALDGSQDAAGGPLESAETAEKARSEAVEAREAREAHDAGQAPNAAQTAPGGDAALHDADPADGKTGEGENAAPQAADTENAAPRARELGEPRNAARPAADGPALLYAGRIEPGKGVGELLDHLRRFRNDTGAAPRLWLIGEVAMELPAQEGVEVLGFVDEEEKIRRLRAATVLVAPSPLESFGIVALEAMAAGTPPLVNAAAGAAVEHCRKANAGLYYRDYPEFRAALELLLGDASLRAAMAKKGASYVREHYSWPRIVERYEQFLST